jgi:hypothetical protein
LGREPLIEKSALFVTIMVMCSIMGQFATKIYLPSIPNMAKYFAVDIAKIQLIKLLLKIEWKRASFSLKNACGLD